MITSYQLGPLLLEARGVYSSGNKAGDNLAKTIKYYQPLDTDGNYWAGGWTQFFASAVDYFNQGYHDRQLRRLRPLRPHGPRGAGHVQLHAGARLYGVVHGPGAQAVDTDTASQLASAGALAPGPADRQPEQLRAR